MACFSHSSGIKETKHSWPPYAYTQINIFIFQCTLDLFCIATLFLHFFFSCLSTFSAVALYDSLIGRLGTDWNSSAFSLSRCGNNPCFTSWRSLFSLAAFMFKTEVSRNVQFVHDHPHYLFSSQSSAHIFSDMTITAVALLKSFRWYRRHSNSNPMN